MTGIYIPEWPARQAVEEAIWDRLSLYRRQSAADIAEQVGIDQCSCQALLKYISLSWVSGLRCAFDEKSKQMLWWRETTAALDGAGA